jgi:hypothetical protein
VRWREKSELEKPTSARDRKTIFVAVLNMTDPSFYGEDCPQLDITEHKFNGATFLVHNTGV